MLLLLTCASIKFKGEACSASWNAYSAYNPQVGIIEKNAEKLYLNPIPNEVKLVGGTVGSLYKKEIKFTLVRNIYVDIRDQGRSTIGYQYKF